MARIPLFYHQSQPAQGGGNSGLASVGSPTHFPEYEEARARIEAFNQRRQAAHDFRVEKELELAQNEAWGQFQETLAERGGEAKWGEEWEKGARAALRAFEAGGERLRGVSREGRERIELRRRFFEQEKRLSVQQQATARGIAVAQKVAFDSADSDWAQGNEAGATATYAQMVERKLLDPALVPHLIEKGQAMAQREEALRMINTDPIAAQEALRERGPDKGPLHWERLDEAQRYTLTNHADARAHAVRQETYQAFAERMSGGEVLGDKELEELVAAKRLSAKQAKAIREQRVAGGLAPESVRFLELFTAARSYDAGGDTDFALADAIMAESLGMADFDRRRLWAIMEERGAMRGGGSGGAGGGGRLSAFATEARKEVREDVKRRFEGGLYGVWEDEETGGRDEVRYREALMHRAKIEEEIDAFMAKRPEASKVELLRFVEEVEARVRADGLAGDLLGGGGLGTGASAGGAASPSLPAGKSAGGGASPLSLPQVGADNRIIEDLLLRAGAEAGTGTGGEQVSKKEAKK